MQARAPLMIEHRLIERMIAMIGQIPTTIEEKDKIDPVSIDAAVDFIRIYADRTHHGKEEDILFERLDKKPLSNEDRKLMDDLVSEHILGRKMTRELVEATSRYRKGNKSALEQISMNIKSLTDFYPKHIEKEDKVFFPASRKYFTEQEDRTILEEYWEFDRKMIHEKYRLVVEAFEKR